MILIMMVSMTVGWFLQMNFNLKLIFHHLLVFMVANVLVLLLFNFTDVTLVDLEQETLQIVPATHLGINTTTYDSTITQLKQAFQVDLQKVQKNQVKSI